MNDKEKKTVDALFDSLIVVSVLLVLIFLIVLCNRKNFDYNVWKWIFIVDAVIFGFVSAAKLYGIIVEPEDEKDQ